jgi:hypothetical protein
MHARILGSQKIEQNGWKQGAILLISSVDELYKRELLATGLYIVLSQDCDVLTIA